MQKRLDYAAYSVFYLMTVHAAGAALNDPEVENGRRRIYMGEFVQMTAETLGAIIQSDAEMSAMRYAYKAGWI